MISVTGQRPIFPIVEGALPTLFRRADTMGMPVGHYFTAADLLTMPEDGNKYELVHGERAFRVGARGYLVKQEATEKVIIAIRKILAGEVYLSERMQSVLLQKVRGKSAGHPVSVLSRLTDREYEIFRLIGLGLGASEIASKLSRSVKTVEAHRANLKQKLGLRNAHELNRFAANWADRERV